MREEVLLNQLQNEIYRSLSQDKWTTQKELIQLLEKNYGRTYKSRRLRKIIKECRLLYKENCLELVIIKSNKGYKLSDDLDEIYHFTQELIECGESMSREGQEIYQAAVKKSNTAFNKSCQPLEDYCKDCIEKMIKNKQFTHLQLAEITLAMASGLEYSSILLFADVNFHPYIMQLARNALCEGIDKKSIKAILDLKLSAEDADKAFRELNAKNKEMREIEI